MRTVLILILAVAVAGCRTPQKDDSTMTLSEFQKKARAYNSVVSLPKFETTPEQILATVRKTIKDGNAALDRIAAIKPGSATFRNTVVALDDLGFNISENISRIYLIKETSTDAKMRAAATAAVKDIEEWAVGLDYREDVYLVLKAFADTQPSLAGEDAKLFQETMRDYKRAGLELPRAERDEVERMRKELSRLETDFQSNVTAAEKELYFTKAELAGVPEAFLEQIKGGEDRYKVQVNVTWQYITVMDNASNEAVRRKVYYEYSNLARGLNVPLLEQILVLRYNIAKKLGYANWADYKTEVKMVGTGAAAIEFLENLEAGLQPKFKSEMEILRQMKTNETSDVTAAIHIWDWRYFANQLKKEKYTVDKEQLRVYFPYQRAVAGMFDIYQRIFGLKFYLVEPPYKWIGDLQLYAVADSQTGEPLGLFYLDMFPREGKYNHFAQFGLIDGKRLPNGKYQRPTVALICNFPAPTKDKPSLLSHDDVETLFHEFGHAMHSILTRASYTRFSGTSVPRDFVEAPSQMLENWVWDKTVLDSFAADYRDPSKKIPQETLAKLKESRLATEGLRYRRQLSFGLLDLTLHTQITAKNAAETLPLSNLVLSEVFMPVGDDTAFIGYFGHLMGYDAGYYGYAWADAISADMATVFENAPNGYFDVAAGMKLRKEIYEPGDSRDVNISIEEFLGRPRSLQPFLKQIGIGN
ncbi:MAG TPA: M3 family metallopeptidase [Verrucomicrobiota bacterium]|nr:M3 family metallopeptidase [Verrucomicrobiota bacterium]